MFKELDEGNDWRLQWTVTDAETGRTYTGPEMK